MAKLSLLVMAAGIGSRYGGLKQMEPFGPGGELLIDYSIYDAVRAGFDRVIFLLRREMAALFQEKIGRGVGQQVETAYVFQELAGIPPGFIVPPGREKPWGTGHAVLSCREIITTPFAVINADDFYGAGAYRSLAGFLSGNTPPTGDCEYCLVGYDLGHTLSEHGSVARGVCTIGPDGYLIDIKERTRIEMTAGGARYTENGTDYVSLPAATVVSMNMWGFTPGVFDGLADGFTRFLCDSAANILKAEYYIPEAVGRLIRHGQGRVKVLTTDEKWFGITYREDRPRVRSAIHKMVRQGVYPEKLWH